MARILVTGGCGFIGSHLGQALYDQGDTVVVMDDLSTGSTSNLTPGARLLVGDINDRALLEDACQGVDAVFHLAAIASVERGVRDWTGTHRANLSGTIAVLDAARVARVPVVYASSAAVYGAGGHLPLDESQAVSPLSAYGADKLGCEQHARVGGHVHGMATVGMRFFNVFGPRQDPRSPYTGVISVFCDRLRRGQPVDVFGDGLQTRDFVHVGDVVAALLAALPAASTAAPVFNVCTGQPTSVLRLAETIAELCDTPLKVNWRPGRAGEIAHSLGERAKARDALLLAEPMPLRAGLQDTLAWLDERGDGAATGTALGAAAPLVRTAAAA